MRILQLYNNYQSGGGGETTMVRATETILRQHGHEVTTIWRDNHAITTLGNKIGAFFSGIYSRSAQREVSELLRDSRPDVVHVANLYPLFSPSAIMACRALGIPVVMSVQNHQMTCPTAAHFSGGEVCERCMGGHEYKCITHNCKGDRFQSAGYALRSAIARKAGWYKQGVTKFVVISEAVRARMLREGYLDSKIVVIPNSVPVLPATVEPGGGSYVGYVGRLSVEKGLSVLLDAARQSGVPIRIAGDGKERPGLEAQASANVNFTGWLDRKDVADFYHHARFTVIPSVWPEPFGLVATEAMSYGLPVIAARSGALPEIVKHNVTGLIYDPQNAAELAHCLRRLWESPEECARLGANGRASVMKNFDIEKYYLSLVSVYKDAIAEEHQLQAANPLASTHPIVSTSGDPRAS